MSKNMIPKEVYLSNYIRIRTYNFLIFSIYECYNLKIIMWKHDTIFTLTFDIFFII